MRAAEAACGRLHCGLRHLSWICSGTSDRLARVCEMSALDSKVPPGPIAQKWDKHKFEMKLVNPANKRKYSVIVVGTGLAGASAGGRVGGVGVHCTISL